jgi:hypothetical protein
MKVDFNVPLLDLDGNTINDNGTILLASKIMANHLMGQKSGDALKLFSWAQKIYKNEVLELDPSDFKTLKKIVDDSDFAVITKKVLIDCVDKAEKSE